MEQSICAKAEFELRIAWSANGWHTGVQSGLRLRLVSLLSCISRLNRRDRPRVTGRRLPTSSDSPLRMGQTRDRVDG